MAYVPYELKLWRLIPETQTCPICYQHKPKLMQWARTNVGDAVCRVCYFKFPEVQKDQFRQKFPENCPVCNTHVPIAKSSTWTKVAGTYLCSACVKMPELEGSYRVDMRGRQLRIVDEQCVEYVNGLGRRPKITYASSLLLFEAQRRRMWATVITYESLCDEVVSRYRGDRDELRAVAEDALSKAALEIMWRFKRGGNFRDYARVAIRNAITNHLRHEQRLARPKCEINDLHLYVASLIKDDEDIRRSDGQIAATIVNAVLESLSPDDAYIVKRHFYEGASWEEIGLEYGVIKQAIHNRWARIKNRLLQAVAQKV